MKRSYRVLGVRFTMPAMIFLTVCVVVTTLSLAWALARVIPAADFSGAATSTDAALAISQAQMKAVEREIGSLYMASTIFLLFASIIGVFFAYFEIATRRDTKEQISGILRRQERFDEVHLESLKDQRKIVQNEVDMGTKVIEKFGTMLENQISSLANLSGVIGLVKSTFETQREQHDATVKALEKIEVLTRELDDLKRNEERVFDDIYGNLKPFALRSRMEWPSLTEQDRNELRDASDQFRKLSDRTIRMLHEQRTKEVAHVRYLLGVGSYYTNSLRPSISHLESAKSLYEHLPDCASLPLPDQLPWIFSMHFLGVIDKSWCKSGMSPLQSFHSAFEHLKRADELLARRPGEYLTPVTLAEVLTYLPGDKGQATERLTEIINQINKEANKNTNQKSLLSRALLYRGNIRWLQRDLKKAAEDYAKAGKNCYATFSHALTLSRQNGQAKSGRTNGPNKFGESLEILVKSRHLETKTETTNRGMLLAIAAIASAGSKDPAAEDHHKNFHTFCESVRPTADRTPMFFCPRQKRAVFIEELKMTVDEWVEDINEGKAIRLDA